MSTLSCINFISATIVAIAATLGSGWLHGYFSQEKHLDATLPLLGQRLELMPETTIGAWDHVASESLAAVATKQLDPSGYLLRTYVHRQRGWQVKVFVLVGRHGPLSVHTPDVCYSANDYTLSGTASMSFSDSSGRRQELRTIKLRSNDAGAEQLQSSFGWSRGAKWLAPKNPRFAFIGAPYLYKIQAVARVPGSQDSGEILKDFLREFLPVLHEYMTVET